MDKDFYDPILYDEFSLPKQADAIRAALLNKYGGMWLDCDTIITSEKFRDLISFDSDFIIAGKHIGFIVARPDSRITSKWVEEIKTNIKNYKNFKPNLFKKIFKNKEYNYYTGWDYLGNSILNKYLKKGDDKICHIIKKKEIQMLPEKIYSKKTFNNQIKQYKYFYFKQTYNDEVLKNNKGMIYLHNSWTPDNYKKMSKDEFLSKNIMLSGLLKNILF